MEERSGQCWQLCLGNDYAAAVNRRVPDALMNAAADELDEEMLSDVLSSDSGDEEMQERPEGFERWETEDQIEWMCDNVWSMRIDVSRRKKAFFPVGYG